MPALFDKVSCVSRLPWAFCLLSYLFALFVHFGDSNYCPHAYMLHIEKSPFLLTLFLKFILSLKLDASASTMMDSHESLGTLMSLPSTRIIEVYHWNLFSVNIGAISSDFIVWMANTFLTKPFSLSLPINVQGLLTSYRRIALFIHSKAWEFALESGTRITLELLLWKSRYSPKRKSTGERHHGK